VGEGVTGKDLPEHAGTCCRTDRLPRKKFSVRLWNTAQGSSTEKVALTNPKGAECRAASGDAAPDRLPASLSQSLGSDTEGV